MKDDTDGAGKAHVELRKRTDCCCQFLNGRIIGLLELTETSFTCVERKCGVRLRAGGNGLRS